VVRLNNLVSFTNVRERADEFGDWILEARVPVVKLLLFPGLLSTTLLTGEGEVIALGGHYRVKASYA
jgi:NAD+--dinitrogen-reductase ADP-D-ribosyltransferase